MQSFDVKGMTCNHCVTAVKSAIQLADAHAKVHIDLATGKVLVSEETAPAQTIINAITEEGYEAIPA